MENIKYLIILKDDKEESIYESTNTNITIQDYKLHTDYEIKINVIVDDINIDSYETKIFKTNEPNNVTGLFGNNNNQNNFFGNNNMNKQVDGLFGNNNMNKQVGGLFGNNNMNKQVVGLFGNNNINKQVGGIFGNNNINK